MIARLSSIYSSFLRFIRYALNKINNIFMVSKGGMFLS